MLKKRHLQRQACFNLSKYSCYSGCFNILSVFFKKQKSQVALFQQASSPHLWNLIELEFNFEQCNDETLWDVGIRIALFWSELNITAVWSSECTHNRHKIDSRMKHMKGYLSERLVLHHVGRDEKQTENVHGMLKKKMPCTLAVCVGGNAGWCDLQLGFCLMLIQLLSQHVLRLR